jgi:hypothetical protein
MATGNSTHPGTGDESAAVDQLNDTDPGRWQVTTHTSIYLIDLDQLLRVPGAGPEHGLNTARHQVYVIRDLPGDHQLHLLGQVPHCQVGQPMRLLVRTDRPGIATSTPVHEIGRLAPPTARTKR